MTLERQRLLQLVVMLLVATALVFAALSGVTRTHVPDNVVRVSAAEIWSGQGSAVLPPDDSPEWRAVTLPHTVYPGERQAADVWVRLSVADIYEDFELPNVVLTRPNAALAIYVNRHLLTSAGIDADRQPWFRFNMRYNLSRAFRADDPQVLHLRMQRQQLPITVRPVRFMANDDAQRYKRGLNLIQKTWPHWTAAALAVMGVLHLGLLLLKRDEVDLGIWGLAQVGWALHIWSSLTNVPPAGSWPFWTAVMHGSLGLFSVASNVFILRAALGQSDRIVSVLWRAGAAAIALNFILSAIDFELSLAYAGLIFVPALLVLAGYAISCLFVSVLRSRHSTNGWLLVQSFVVAALGVRDYLMDMGLLADAEGEKLRFLLLAAPIAILTFGSVLLIRFVSSFKDAEVLNRNLEQRVQEKSAQLSEGMHKLVASESRQARMEERHRLMRDMHDGVGGQLVQTLAILRKRGAEAEVVDALQGCLDDLRLILESGDPDSGSLHDALAQFRHRMLKRCQSMGFTLDWPWKEMPSLPFVHPGATLHLLRILQELIVNSVKHSDGDRIMIRFHPFDHESPRTLTIDYADNGQGLSLEDPNRLGSKGITSVRVRAASLGGSFRITCFKGCFAAEVRIPLHAFLGTPSTGEENA